MHTLSSAAICLPQLGPVFLLETHWLLSCLQVHPQQQMPLHGRCNMCIYVVGFVYVCKDVCANKQGGFFQKHIGFFHVCQVIHNSRCLCVIAADMFIYMYIYIYTYIHTSMYVCMYVYSFIYNSRCLCVIAANMCMYVCMHECMCVYVCTHIHMPLRDRCKYVYVCMYA